jgi:hypothetical protein
MLLGAAVAIGGSALYAPFGEIAWKVAVIVACIGFVIAVFIVGAFGGLIQTKRRPMHSAAIVAFSMSSFFVAFGLAAMLVAFVFVGLAVFTDIFPQQADRTDGSLAEGLGIGVSVILVVVTSMVVIKELWRATRQTRRANG